MHESNSNKFHASINIKQRQYPFSAIRNQISNSKRNSNKIIPINNTNTNSNSNSNCIMNTNTNTIRNTITVHNSNSKNSPIKIHSKPSSGTMLSSIKTPLAMNEQQHNTITHNKSNSSHKKEFVINQIDQVINHSKQQSANSVNYPPIRNFKAIPRNPFKNTQITSIKNVVFTEQKPTHTNSCPTVEKEYNALARSVSEYAYREDMNAEHRKTMEDFHKIIDSFCNDHSKGFFSIYDGHGGTECIKYIKDRLPEIFSKFLYDTNFNVEKSFIYSFQRIDDEIKCFSETENVGCTATVVFIFKEYDTIHGNRRVLYCANVGDSKSVLIRNGEIEVLTTEHKCSNDKELERIKGMGGIVFNSRLFGQLALSRALGDHSMKNNGLICTPAISKRFIDVNDKYIIIASDGIWDTVSNDDLIRLSSIDGAIKQKDKDKDNSNITAESLCRSIIAIAIEKGSYDNISCITIKL